MQPSNGHTRALQRTYTTWSISFPPYLFGKTCPNVLLSAATLPVTTKALTFRNKKIKKKRNSLFHSVFISNLYDMYGSRVNTDGKTPLIGLSVNATIIQEVQDSIPVLAVKISVTRLVSEQQSSWGTIE